MNEKQKSKRQKKKKLTKESSESLSSEDSDVPGPSNRSYLTTASISSKATGHSSVQTIPHQASAEGKESRKNSDASRKKATESVDIFAEFRDLKITGKVKEDIKMAHSINVANANKTLMRIRKNLKRHQEEQQASNTHFKEVSKNTAVQNYGECALPEEKTDKLKKELSSSAGLCNDPDQSYSDKKGKKKRIAQCKSTYSQFENTRPQTKQANPQIKKAVPLVKKVDLPIKMAEPQIKRADPPNQKADPQIKMVVPLVKKVVLPIKMANPQIKRSDPPNQKADPQIKISVPLVKKVDLPIKIAIPPIKRADPTIKKADPPFKKAYLPFKKADIEYENADPHFEMIDQLFENIPQIESSEVHPVVLYNDHKNDFNKTFEEVLEKQVKIDANAVQISTNIFLKGLPIIEDVNFYKKLWEELKAPFSFHENIWYGMNSVSENRNYVRKSSEHIETLKPEAEIENNLNQENYFESSKSKFQPVQDQKSFVCENPTPAENVSLHEATEEFRKLNLSPERTLKPENDETCDSSSPDSQLKGDSSISNEPNFSGDSQSSSESSSGNSVITVVPANFRASDSEIEEKLKQEFPKLDSSPENTDFSSNTKASEETVQNLDTSNSSVCSFITSSDVDKNDSYGNTEDELENDNWTSASSEQANSSWSEDNEIKRISDFALVNDATAKLKEGYQWLYDVDISMQKAFDGLFVSAYKILRFIFTSRPEAYKDQLLNYASSMTLLNQYSEKVQLEYQNFLKEVEETESLHNSENSSAHIAVLGKKGLFIMRYYSFLKKYHEKISDLLATTRTV